MPLRFIQICLFTSSKYVFSPRPNTPFILSIKRPPSKPPLCRSGMPALPKSFSHGCLGGKKYGIILDGGRLSCQPMTKSRIVINPAAGSVVCGPWGRRQGYVQARLRLIAQRAMYACGVQISRVNSPRSALRRSAHCPRESTGGTIKK